MKYISTRKNFPAVSGIEAIKMGMVPMSGLFVPEKIPIVSSQQLNQWKNHSYAQLAQDIFLLFLEKDFSQEEINHITRSVYQTDHFNTEEITPLKILDNQLFILELFHGPTGAFKDIALQVLPHILSKSLKKLSISNQILILVATSGDTGKAALEGFKDVPGVQIIVYYPFQKVSKIQELQMLTTGGNNTHVIAIQGDFDDCQNAVKQIFSDKIFCQSLLKKGFEFSSANSINWGRLFPQIVYYFYAYLSLIKNNQIQFDEKINFVVPTGNFGNILAAWYAQKMGLPIEKLICASNINRVLTDFFQQGVYNRNRPLIPTISPSMDILISSNLERFLFEISEHQEDCIIDWMEALREKGQFTIDKKIKKKIDEIILAGYASEEETLETIQAVYHDYHYLVDPHTAVGIKVFRTFQNLFGQNKKTVIDATATPFKFNQSVLTALLGEHFVRDKDEFSLLEELSQYTRLPVPAIFEGLANKKINQPLVYDKKSAKKSLEEILRQGND